MSLWRSWHFIRNCWWCWSVFSLWSELVLLQNVFRSTCYWWVGFLYYRLKFCTFPRHKVIEIWFYCLFHCSFCNELEFWCPPYDCPNEFFSSSANRLGFHIRRFDQLIECLVTRQTKHKYYCLYSLYICFIMISLFWMFAINFVNWMHSTFNCLCVIFTFFFFHFAFIFVEI